MNSYEPLTNMLIYVTYLTKMLIDYEINMHNQIYKNEHYWNQYEYTKLWYAYI